LRGKSRPTGNISWTSRRRARSRCFTDVGDGSTRVDLEHRHFERHGDGAEKMKMGVDSAQGWGSLLQLFAQRAEQ
jgi:hypothetical protein